jgi:hypothetical protein
MPCKLLHLGRFAVWNAAGGELQERAGDTLTAAHEKDAIVQPELVYTRAMNQESGSPARNI